MRKDVLTWELRKLWSLPMIPVFMILCIAFNMLIIFATRNGNEYVRYIIEVTEEIGGQMGGSFDRLLSAHLDSKYKNTLISETSGAVDIFSQFDATEIGELYINTYKLTGAQADRLERKYNKLQDTVKILDEQDASLSLSAAGMTRSLTDALFQYLCRAVITEGLLLTVLMALYSSGYEKLNRTALSVYSTRTGRGIQRAKFAASTLSALGTYVLLAASSVGVFALLWDMGPIWNASMSSQFNYIISMGLELPFVTWKRFTVAGYLAATLGLGAMVVLLFHGFGFVFGLLTGDAYKGFVVFLMLGALNFATLVMTGDSGEWLLYQLVQWSPVTLWWFQPLWFTDMNIATVFPWQECWETVFCTGLCIGLLMLARRYLHRKDVA